MSTTIDERVVEMRFDNQNFERNARESMSTLDKLKRSLKLDGAAKGFEEIDSASRKVNMNGLGSAVETVSAKFSALQVMGVTALVNITNQAVNAGKRMVAAFTIDPVKTGFQEYELKMGSVQTIMASTGESLATVNKYLEELNTYSDKTIYSFSDMTNNIGKFTNAGVKLEDAVLAIKGISNEAAVSGANANEASRAMYNFSQALSAGYVKLIDWKSIENANMATVEFKNQLIASAVACGTLKDNLDGTYTTLEKGTVISATRNFNDSLQEQWMTTEVLTKTLANYATDVREMSAAEKEAYEEKLRGQGYTEEQIKSIEELGKKAFDSAQDIKTFSMMMDTLKEAAQSGWARTWELLIGDFEQAKAFWTELGGALGGFIDKMSKARNDLLESALGKGFTELTERVKSAVKPIQKSADSIKSVVDAVKDYGKVVDEIIGGKWGDGQARWDKLTEAGYDWAHAQNLVNEKLGSSVKYATDYAEAQDKVKKSQDETADSTVKLTRKEKSRLKLLMRLSEEDLKLTDYSQEQIETLKELKNTADKLGLSVDDLIDNIDEIDGRWLLINSLKNAGKGLVTVFQSIGAAWRQAFHGNATDEAILNKRSEAIFNLIAAVHKFSTKLVMSDDTAKKLTRTFKGLFAILDLITTITGGTLKIGFKILTEILSLFDMDILDLTANIGDMVVKFRDWVDSILDFSAIFEKIYPNIKNFVDNIKEWLNGFKGVDNIPRYILESLKTAFSTVGRYIKTKFQEFSSTIVDDAMEFMLRGFAAVPTNIMEGFEKGFLWGILSVIKAVRTFCLKIITTVKDIFLIHSPSVVFFEIGQNLIQGFINGVTSMFTKAIEVVKKLFEGSKEAVEDSNIGEAFDKILEGAKKFCIKIVDIFKGVNLGKLFAAALGIGMLLTAKKALDVLEMFAKPLEGFGDLLSGIGNAFSGFGKRLKSKAMLNNAKALLLMSVSIMILVSAILPLTEVNLTDLVKAGAALIIIIGALVGLGYAVGKLSTIDMKLSFNILAIASSLAILAYSMKMLSQIPAENMDSTIKMFASMILGLAGIFLAFGLFISVDKTANMDKAGLMIFKMAAALLTITSVVKIISGFKQSDINKGLKFITGVVVLFSLVTMVSMFAGANADNAGAMMLKMSVAILVMAAVVKIASGFTDDEIKNGLKFVAGVELLFIGVIAVSQLAGQNGKIAGSMLLKMALSILTMVGIVKIVSNMTESDIKKGLIVISAIELLFGGIIAVSHLAGKYAGKAGLMLVAMAFAVSILAGILFVVSKMDQKEIYKALPIIGAFELMFMGLIAVTKYAKSVESLNKTLIIMLVTVGLLLACIIGLSYIEPKELATASAALSGVMAMFALMMVATKFTKNTSDMRKSMATLLGVTAGLAAIIALLSLTDTDSAMKSAGALSIILLSFSASIVILSKADRVLKTAVDAMYPMFSILLGLAGILSIMSLLKIETSLNNAIALGVILNAFTSSIVVLSKAGKVSDEALDSVYRILGITAGLAAILGIMAAFKVEASMNNAVVLGVILNEFAASIVVLSKAGDVSLNALVSLKYMIAVTAGLAIILGIMAALKVEASITSAISLGILLNALANSMAILSRVGYISKDTLKAAAGLGLVLGELAIVLGIMSKMNVKSAIPYAIALSILLVSLTVVAGILGAMSLLIDAAIPAVEGLGIVIAELAIVLAAIGALSKIPGLEWLITEGGDLLQTIGVAIGKFIGGIIGGIASGAASVLPSIAISLSLFMLFIQPFINGAKNIKGDVVKGVGFLTAAILALAVGTFVAGVATLAGLSLIDLALTLNNFAKYIQPFVDQISTIKPEAVEAAKTIADMILVLAASDLVNAITSFIGGTSDISSFGAQLEAFGEAVVKFNNILKENGGIDESAVTSAAAAGTMLAELQSKLYGVGGLKQDIFGEKDLGNFGAQLEAFGKAMVNFSNAITRNGGIDAEAIEGAATAGSLMAELTNSLPKTGGLWQDVAGEQDIALFGVKCAVFGSAMKLFSDSISGENAIDAGAIEAAAKAGELMAELQNSLPKTGGMWQTVAGEKDISDFGAKCAAFGEAMSKFPTVSISDESISSVTKAGTAISKLVEIIPKEGGWIQKIAGEQDLEGFGNGCKLFSQAMVNLEGIKITDDVITSIGKAKGAIEQLLTIVPKEGGWSSILSGGDKDLEGFASGCHTFSQALVNLEGLKITDESITSIKTAGDMLVTLQNSIPDSSYFDSKINLEEFSGHITKFKDALLKLSNITLSEDAIGKVESAGNMLVELQKSIPDSKWRDGKVDLDEFGKDIKKFGAGILKVSKFSMTDDDIESVRKVGGMLIELRNSMPDSGWFNGKMEIDDFGKKIKSFGGHLAGYSEKISGIDFGAISSSVTQTNKFVTLANNLVGLDLSGIEDFKIKELGSALNGYYNKIDSIDFSIVSSSISSVRRLKSLIQGMAGLDNSGVELFNIKSIGDKLKAYADAVSGIDTELVSSSISNANRLRSFVASLAGLDTSGVGSFKTAIEQLGTTQIGNIVSAFNNAATTLYTTGANIINSVTNGMQSRQPYMIGISRIIVNSVIINLRKMTVTFRSVGILLMTQFALGMNSQCGKVTTTVKSLASSAVSSIKGYYTNFYSAGAYLVDGFVSGISANTFRAEAQAAAMAEAAKTAAEKALGINSPSKVFYQIGDYTGQGFVNALVDYGRTAYDSASSMADYARKGMTNAIGRIQDLINSDMDSQPTIRPVLDLSDVKSGVEYMNGILPSRTSIGVMSNLNSISSMMNRNNQNGEYDEVVSAIEGLRKDLGNTGDTYIIDGVTYDDGSAVSNAMQTIVRAAKIERRV